MEALSLRAIGTAMVKDKLFRTLFIPLLGLVIPLLAGAITYSSYSQLELIAIAGYFIFMSWCIWSCSAWLHHQIRKWFTHQANTFVKISTISLTNSLFGGAIVVALSLIYYKISGEPFSWSAFFLLVVLSILAVVVFTLIYEILYLSTERVLDSKVVHQLDAERTEARMSNLQNELEPHFMFNSLNTLSHLILDDPAVAHTFNRKLAGVYKYFLVNKDKEMISLQSEIEFMESYFFLLKLRFEDKLQLLIKMDTHESGEALIMPFSLQTALENAIKHNEFSEVAPLCISMERNADHIVISNPRKPKLSHEDSVGIGLKNLRERYLLAWNKSIQIVMADDKYTVSIPLIYENQKS